MLNKRDLARAAGGREAARVGARATGWRRSASRRPGAGLDGAARGPGRSGWSTRWPAREFPAATRERHRRDLIEARGHLRGPRARSPRRRRSELAAEDVRLAARGLERIAGRVDPEDVLDRVFARFCIGK